MDKKELKFYEAPATEVVELNVSVAILTSSPVEGLDNSEDITGGNKGKWGDED